MSKDLTSTAKFNFLRYANCWEDPEILLDGLRPVAGSRILSIGSAGDNSFSLLTTDPSLVVAVDVSEVQLHLIRLKIACFKNMTRDATLRFLGFNKSETRIQDFNALAHDLPDETRAYWTVHLKRIENGVIHEGKFEKYFQLFAGKILPLIHSRKTVERLLSLKSPEAQQAFYTDTWNSWRWRLLFRLFFSKYVMGKKGRDPAFLTHVEGSVSDFIYRRAGSHLRSVAAQTNPFLRYNLTGDFGTLLPHYLEEANYDIIQNRIDRLILHQGYVQDASKAFGPFDCMNLSDIFEYMDPAQFEQVSLALIEGLNEGGRAAYWNLMVDRRISRILPEQVTETKTTIHSNRADNGFFYKGFFVDEKRSLFVQP